MGKKEVIPSFGQGKKQGQKKSHNNDPRADENIGGNAPGENPQHKTSGNTNDIYDRQVFQKDGVRDVEDDIGAYDK